MKKEEMIAFFCKNVKSIRLQNKLSKKEMAKKLKICPKTLSSIEKGILPPRLKFDIVIRIYRNFGILPSVIASRDITKE